MKKVLALITTIVMMFSIGANSFASEKEFNLINYLENHSVNSHEELIEVLAEASGYPLESMPTYSQNNAGIDQEVSFSYKIDYVNNIVEVDTVYETPAKAAINKTGSATHETYSAVGALMYTVKIVGSFSYTTNYCINTSRTGTYTKGSGSSWSSTPTTTYGTISQTKAYARVSGTAKLLLQKSTYELTLMCDSSGKLTSSFRRP